MSRSRGAAERLRNRLVTLAAFIKRDFLIEVSYRTAFLMQFVSMLFSVTLFYFIARRVIAAPPATPGLRGVDYFAFLLVGLATMHYLTSALVLFSNKIRNEQMTGTLEAMLVTPTPIGTIVLGSALWDFILTSFKVVGYLVVGAVFFGVVIHPEGILTAVVVLALTILAFAGIGILSAAFVLYLKRGDPITWLVASASMLVGNVFYPSEDMWPWLGRWSAFLPITYALRALRGALLDGRGLGEVLPDIKALVLFAIVLVPLGVLAFRVAVRKARQEGSLVQY